MQPRKIIIAGGNGYLGRLVTRHFLDKGERVIVLSRHPIPEKPNLCQVLWDGATLGTWAVELENADVLLNLAGRA